MKKLEGELSAQNEAPIVIVTVLQSTGEGLMAVFIFMGGFLPLSTP